jgi:hypothetical protein
MEKEGETNTQPIFYSQPIFCSQPILNRMFGEMMAWIVLAIPTTSEKRVTFPGILCLWSL